MRRLHLTKSSFAACPTGRCLNKPARRNWVLPWQPRDFGGSRPMELVGVDVHIEEPPNQKLPSPCTYRKPAQSRRQQQASPVLMVKLKKVDSVRHMQANKEVCVSHDTDKLTLRTTRSRAAAAMVTQASRRLLELRQGSDLTAAASPCDSRDQRGGSAVFAADGEMELRGRRTRGNRIAADSAAAK